MAEKEMAFEKEYFEEVKSFIEKDSARLSEFADSCFKLVKEQGEKFNEDNPNGGMYSGMELTELHYEMQNEMLRAEEAKNDIRFYKKLIKEPYFARIDFTSDKTKKKRAVYIGLKTLQDPETYDALVCDWRAPVASLFYEDFEGRASFEAPAGKIEGDLSLKRQFKFKGGELEYYVDSDLKINDDILRDVLSTQSGDGGLKVIVNSIQREQNKAIRYSESKNLLVKGAAGSGKTSVGFHRLAYLLYRNRKELSSAETVMFSNNDIFSSYVADIIPELGEMPINYSSFYSIFSAELPTYSCGDYYELADELISGNTDRRKSVSLKFCEDFWRTLKDAADSFVPEFKDVEFLDKTAITADELLERFSCDESATPVLRGERLIDFANGKIEDFFTENYTEIFDIVNEETAIDEDTGRAIVFRRRILKQDAARMIQKALNFDPVVIYSRALCKYVDGTGADSCVKMLTEDAVKCGKLLFEDAVCTVRLKQFLGTAAQVPSVKHILIDEAQDLSLIQHKIIREMFPKASYTLLADSNQAILPEVNITDLSVLAKLYNADVLSLNKSYRSTAPINRFALSLLNENERYIIFERDGEDVELLSGGVTENIKKTLAEFSKKSKNIAVIAKTSKKAEQIFRELKKDFPALSLCSSNSGSTGEGACVISLALTKGLEFDGVIVADTDGDFSGDSNKRFLYMAVTRALHRLAICGD